MVACENTAVRPVIAAVRRVCKLIDGLTHGVRGQVDGFARLKRERLSMQALHQTVAFGFDLHVLKHDA